MPYGIRSKGFIEDRELQGIYKRFSKVIKKNIYKLENVFIYMTVQKEYKKDHFINVSGLSWKLCGKYGLGGTEIGLF